MPYNIGIDIGGTTISAGVVDENHVILKSVSSATPMGNAEIFACITGLVERIMANYPNINSIGVGVPGSVFPRNTVSFACNINMSDYPLGDMLEQRFNLPVFLENDANCAALAEYNALKCKSLLMLTIGTGIGGAYIESSKMLTGQNGCALEVGHMSIVCGGRKCACGRSGCFETYASTSALCKIISDYVSENEMSCMAEISRNYESLDARIIFDAMAKNDDDAQCIYEEYIAYLACGITNLINIFQPEVLAIGGAIARQGEVLLAPIREIVSSENYAKNIKNNTNIVTATHFGDAGIIGASLLHSIGENHANC